MKARMPGYHDYAKCRWHHSFSPFINLNLSLCFFGVFFSFRMFFNIVQLEQPTPCELDTIGDHGSEPEAFSEQLLLSRQTVGKTWWTPVSFGEQRRGKQVTFTKLRCLLILVDGWEFCEAGMLFEDHLYFGCNTSNDIWIVSRFITSSRARILKVSRWVSRWFSALSAEQ